MKTRNLYIGKQRCLMLATILAGILCVLIFTGCPNPMDEADNGGDAGDGDSTPTAVTGVSLGQTAATLKTGETLQLTAAVAPDDATDKTVSWSSSNPSAATVSASGLVTAAVSGTAGITATSTDGGKTATCSITVQSSNADLSTLTVSEGTLGPVFDAATTAYSVDVAFGITSVTVSGTPADPNASVSSAVTLEELESEVPQTATITVTAEDGETQKNYTVTVTRAANNAKEITAFGFTTPAVSGVITGTDIAVTVPYATDVTSLIAAFSTTGSNVSVGIVPQTSGETVNDFTNPVTYTVTAADGSTRDYTVTVAVALNDAKEITAFDFMAANNIALENDVSGNIDGTAIDVNVPSGTDLTALIATFTTTGETVSVGAISQTSGSTANNFTSPVTYTVTAENGTTEDYTVTVNIAVTPYLDFTYGTGGYEVELSTEGNSALTAGTIDSIEIPSEYSGEPVNAISFRGFDVIRHSGCSNLVSITIPDSITSVGEYAFRNCSSLSSITIPGNITAIEDGTFGGCTSLSSVSLPDSVTFIGVGAFGNCSSLTSIVIPAQVEIIGAGSFDGCSNLQTVTISDGLIVIESYAFLNCSSLSAITIPDTVTSIESQAFNGCSDLSSIDLSTNLSVIDTVTFYNCISLASIIIPDGVTEIRNSAFEGCSNLSSVSLPDGLDIIGVSAFENCTSLNAITIPSGITGIYDSAFRGCSGLTTVTIPSGITTIGGGLFADCSSLSSVTIPVSVSNILGSAFKNCTSLTSISLPANLSSIGDSVFQGCSNLTSVTIPDSVTSLGDYVFQDCSSLSSAVLPASISAIGDQLFLRSGLVSIDIPSTVSSIGSSAFYGCTSLATLNMHPNSAPALGNSAVFLDVSGCALHYPSGASGYNVSPWSDSTIFSSSTGDL